MTVNGADLAAELDAYATMGQPLQVSGLTYTWHPDVTPEVTVVDVEIGGVPITATGTYRVVVNSIIAPDLVNATDATGLGVDLDLLVPYLTASSPLSPPSGTRIAIAF